MFETFSTSARKAVESAQREAREMRHGAVDVEHLLLGLFLCEDEMMSEIWSAFGLMIRPVRETVRQRVLSTSPGPAGHLPFSPAAKDALRSADGLGLGQPSPAHLLIVLTRRGEGGASEVLEALGVDPNQVRFLAKKRASPRRALTKPQVPRQQQPTRGVGLRRLVSARSLQCS